MNNFNRLNFQNQGVIICDVPYTAFTNLLTDINNVTNNKILSKLQKITTVGHIESAIRYELKVDLKDFIKEACNFYTIEYNRNSNYKEIVYDDAWINVQKKFEYQPNHQHIGSYSWVIWCKIPYELTDEDRYHTGNNKEVNCNGRFEIFYSDILGNHQTYKINLDKSYEGKLIMFPAKLRHTVYPFYTSNNYRISLAGNIFVK